MSSYNTKNTEASKHKVQSLTERNPSTLPTMPQLIETAKGYSKEGKIDDAIACYEQALELPPGLALADQAIILNNLGQAYMQKPDLNMAIRRFLKAYEVIITAEPVRPSLLKATIFNNLGKAYYKKSNFADALTYFNQSLWTRDALEKKDTIVKATLLQNIGETYKMLGNFKEATTHLIQVLCMIGKLEYGQKQTLDKTKILYNLGEIFFITKQYEKARKYYKQLIDMPATSQTTISEINFTKVQEKLTLIENEINKISNKITKDSDCVSTKSPLFSSAVELKESSSTVKKDATITQSPKSDVDLRGSVSVNATTKLSTEAMCSKGQTAAARLALSCLIKTWDTLIRCLKIVGVEIPPCKIQSSSNEEEVIATLKEERQILDKINFDHMRQNLKSPFSEQDVTHNIDLAEFISQNFYEGSQAYLEFYEPSLAGQDTHT